MRDYIAARVRTFAQYIIEHRTTVREIANVFDISKSTVHKDLTERLIEVDPQLEIKVRAILDFNLSERHLRGGIATKNKFLGGAGEGK